MKRVVSLLLIACAVLVSARAGEFGANKHVEYLPGDLPLILCSPHGGALKPADIPDRAYGVTGADAYTQELTRLVADEIEKLGGHRPHLILSHLHRGKLDPNREVKEAAQGNPDAIRAWEQYHAFIEKAREAAVKQHGMAFLIDMHGQSHKGERVELGYLHAPKELSQAAEVVNSTDFIAKGSLTLLMKKSGLSYTEVLHGPRSMGALFAARGYRCTPSPQMPVPDEPYFKGGYTVARHCTDATTGFQLEANRSRLRDTPANRLKFAQACASALEEYLAAHLKISLR
jgi:N-formylglutamate amidohydrolase